MARKTKTKYAFKRTVATYGYLRSLSWIAFRRASQQREGRFYDLMISMLSCAFTLEAFLNHVGTLKVPGWSSIERNTGPREKLNRLVSEVAPEANLRKRPFSSFLEIFRFRDKLVHGKTITLVVSGEAYLDKDELPPPPLAKWERIINPTIAQRFLDDTKAIIIHLNTAAGLEKELLFSPAQHEVTVQRAQTIAAIEHA